MHLSGDLGTVAAALAGAPLRGECTREWSSMVCATRLHSAGSSAATYSATWIRMRHTPVVVTNVFRDPGGNERRNPYETDGEVVPQILYEKGGNLISKPKYHYGNYSPISSPTGS